MSDPQKNGPKNLFEIGGRLAIICTVAAIVLALVNAVTAPIIVRNRERELAEALSRIAEHRRVGEAIPIDDHRAVRAIFPVFENDELYGYVVRVIGVGYGGDMAVLVGARLDGYVFAATLMENLETPGLGKKAEAPGYMDKFVGTGADRPVPTRKDQLDASDADAVSGATMTFVGVARAIETASDFVRKME